MGRGELSAAVPAFDRPGRERPPACCPSSSSDGCADTRAATSVAVVGLGRIGELHSDNLVLRVPGAELTAVSDVRDDRARAIAERYSVPWYPDPEHLLAEHPCQAIVIATPTATHPELVRQSAAAGIHTFCEKPLALDVAATAAAVAVAEAAGVQLQIGFHLRSDPAIAELQAAIAAGELGQIVSLRARLRDMCPPPEEYLSECGPLLVDGAVHLFDLARWLVGDITHVTAATTTQIRDGEAPSLPVDCSTAIVQFQSGALGMLENSRGCGYGFDCAVEVVGSKRAGRIGEHRGTQIEWFDAGERRTGLHGDFLDRFGDAYRRELFAFVEAIRCGSPVLPNGQDAIAAASLAEAAEVSAMTGRIGNVGPSGPSSSRLEADASGRPE